VGGRGEFIEKLRLNARSAKWPKLRYANNGPSNRVCMYATKKQEAKSEILV